MQMNPDECRAYLDKIHRLNFKMLCEVDRICRKHKIHYYLLAGTLLGAIRHKDFIPWDDDVDIVMPRKDYMRFLKVCRDELAPEYKLVDPAQYDDFFDFIARVTDITVTFEHQKADTDYYKGRYSHPSVDLFIFDNAGKFFKLRLTALRVVYALAMGHRKSVEFDKYTGIQKIGAYILPAIGRFIPMKYIFKLYDSISSGSGMEDSFYISNDQQKAPYWGREYKKSWFAKRIWGRIGDRHFPCPVGYDEEMTMIYGDYMKIPPVEKQVPEHFFELKENLEG